MMDATKRLDLEKVRNLERKISEFKRSAKQKRRVKRKLVEEDLDKLFAYDPEMY